MAEKCDLNIKVYQAITRHVRRTTTNIKNIPVKESELSVTHLVCFTYIIIEVRVRAMIFIVTFNNISVISWQSVLLVEETGVSGENHRPAASHRQ
jgi:hypothetical protein